MRSSQSIQILRLVFAILCGFAIACQVPTQIEAGVDTASRDTRAMAREDVPRCINGRPNLANPITSAQAERGNLYFAALVRPDFLLRVNIDLEPLSIRPTLSTAAELSEQNAAYKPAIVTRLEELGAEFVHADYWNGMLWMLIPARLAPEIYCWPDVLALGVSSDHRHLSEGLLGFDTANASECPAASESCPHERDSIVGHRFDGSCFSKSYAGQGESLRPQPAEVADSICAQNMLTGDLFKFTGARPALSPAQGWRRCTSVETKLANLIPFCD